MKAQSRWEIGQQGMISMITVMLVGLLLTVITTGFLHIMTRNQHQANDEQSSAQAFYAAESGIEDAKHAIDLRMKDIRTTPPLPSVQLDSNDPVNLDGSPTNCKPALTINGNTDLDGVVRSSTLTAEGGVAYTCQLIDLHPDTLKYDLRAFDQQIANLEVSTGSFDAVLVTWSPLPDDTVDHPKVDPANVGKLKSVTDWGDTMSMLRLQLSSVKIAGAGLTRDQFQRNERSYFVSPTDGGTDSIDVTFCSFVGAPDGCGTDTSYNNAGVRQGSCVGDHHALTCTVKLKLKQPTGLSSSGGTVTQALDNSYSTRLRISSLYQGSRVEVKLLSGAAETVQKTSNAQASIDVTGRSGDVFKRVRVRYPLSGDNFPYPSYGIQSAEDICKLFEVTPTNPANLALGGTITAPATCPL